MPQVSVKIYHHYEWRKQTLQFTDSPQENPFNTNNYQEISGFKIKSKTYKLHFCEEMFKQIDTTTTFDTTKTWFYETAPTQA